MKKTMTVCLVLGLLCGHVFALGGSDKGGKTGGAAAGKYDLKGNTVIVRLWDSPNPYDPATSEADKAKWLPIYEAAKKKYNCNFEFYTSTSNYDDMPAEWIKSVAGGKPAWHITNNLSSMWLMQLAANKALVDISKPLKNVGIPEIYQQTGKVKNGIYGFNLGAGTEGLVFNRKMIAEAGMKYTPSEMFKMGKWSYDDFYAYVTELQNKLPKGTYAFFIDPNYWQIFAAPANGSMAIDNNFKFTALDKGFTESIEFLQKLMKAGVVRPADTDKEGKPDFWTTPAVTFDKGVEVAMTHRAMWQVGGLKGNGVDWGYVPYPWGSQVKLAKAGDYTSLSSNYRAAYYDTALLGVILAGSEKNFPGIKPDMVYEALLHITRDLFIDSDTAARLEKMAKGMKVETELELGDFNDMLSAELYTWETTRTVYNPIVTFGGAKLAFSSGGTVSFPKLIRDIIAGNKPVRASLEAVKAEIEAGFKDAGLN